MNREGFERLILHTASLAGVLPNTAGTESGVHVDVLSDELVIVHNNTDHRVELELNGSYRGVYQGRETADGKVWLDAESAELFVK